MKLTAETVRAIKVDLWEGARQGAVALKHGIRQPTISGIARGYTWPAVEWPDGSIGALSPQRTAEIKKEVRLAGSLPTGSKIDPLIYEIAGWVAVEMRDAEQKIMQGVVETVELTRRKKPQT